MIFSKTERPTERAKGFQLANVESRAAGQEARGEKRDGACKPRGPLGVPPPHEESTVGAALMPWLTSGPRDWEHRAGRLPAACTGRPSWDGGSQSVFQQVRSAPVASGLGGRSSFVMGSKPISSARPV